MATPTNDRNDADLIEAIRSDHQEVKALLQDVSSATGSERTRALHALIAKASAHEAAEQEHVHPLTRDQSGGEAVVEQRLQEESKGKAGLMELQRLGVEAPEFDEKFSALQAAILEHAQSEENEEHPILRQAVDEARLRELVGPYRAFEQRVEAEAGV